MDKEPQLGAWSSDRTILEKTPLTGRGADSDAPNPLRFTRIITQTVARREAIPEAEYDKPAAFVLVPRNWMENIPQKARRQPLLHTGHRPLTGQIHLFTHATASAHSLTYEGDDEDLVDKIESLGAADFPTIIYSPHPQLSCLSWHPKGLSNPIEPEILKIFNDPPTVESITRAIAKTHRDELISPDQMDPSNKVWANATKGWAHEEAEKRIQQAIRLTLLGAFLHCDVRKEQPGKDGRTDLEIVQDVDHQPDQIINHAVIELKVLRERGSSGRKYNDAEIADHIRDGMNQSYWYGEKRNFRDRMLCCFDMRDKNVGPQAAFSHIKEEADSLEVDLSHWYLYRSSREWREAEAAIKLSAG